MGYRPRIGDPIRGTVWLQGYAIKEIADSESWAAIDRSDSTVERLKRAMAAEDYLSDLAMGVKALGSSMAYSGLEVTSYGNYGQSPDIPAFLVEHQGKAINVWVRSYIEDQEPALLTKKRRISETSQRVANKVFASLLSVKTSDRDIHLELKASRVGGINRQSFND